MRVQFRSVLAFAVPVAVAVALACSGGTYSNECAQFGGACVTSEATCNGTLPYSCAVGVCCTPFLDSGIPVTTPQPDATTRPPKVDATIPDATVSQDTGGPEVSTGDDTSTSGDDAAEEASTDSGDDTGTGDAGSDGPTADGSAKDGAADGPFKDAADHDGTVTDAGTSDAAPTCAGFSPPTTVDLCTACLATDPACQLNGCFNGFYCKTTSLTCVPPAQVKCDGGP
jgi:hypothetical protein